MKHPVTQLYILHCEGHYKIGLTMDIKKRLTSLRIGCPFPIEVVKSYDLPWMGENALEHCLHRVFRHRHHTGEWFKLTPIDHIILDWYVGRYIELRGRKWVGDEHTVTRELFGREYGPWTAAFSGSTQRLLPHREDLTNCLLTCLNVVSQLAS